jgi:hypothetical protein
MEFYFKTNGAELHLYREAGFFDEDLGKLTETFTGKLKTNNFLKEDFELEDISGFFSKGEKYLIKSSNGLNGVIEKRGFSDRYILK